MPSSPNNGRARPDFAAAGGATDTASAQAARTRSATLHYGTILEIGSSRMSVAPAAFSSGISRFTPRFSTTVSIA